MAMATRGGSCTNSSIATSNRAKKRGGWEEKLTAREAVLSIGVGEVRSPRFPPELLRRRQDAVDEGDGSRGSRSK